jgi:hypothetical protein
MAKPNGRRSSKGRRRSSNNSLEIMSTINSLNMDD